MEDYLAKDYGVDFDESLTSEDQIEDWFKDYGPDLFDCGQGFYEDVVNHLIYISGKVYEVTITAEIMSAKQDRGDRLYWVDYIESVTWKEIPTPGPLYRGEYTFKLVLSDDEHTKLSALIDMMGVQKLPVF